MTRLPVGTSSQTISAKSRILELKGAIFSTTEPIVCEFQSFEMRYPGLGAGVVRSSLVQHWLIEITGTFDRSGDLSEPLVSEVVVPCVMGWLATSGISIFTKTVLRSASLATSAPLRDLECQIVLLLVVAIVRDFPAMASKIALAALQIEKTPEFASKLRTRLQSIPRVDQQCVDSAIHREVGISH